ncbi:MAG: ATP-binding protein [Candidatus Omnitrophota bacterium]
MLSLQNKGHERSDLLELLEKRVSAFKNKYRQNIAIIGHQALGKTALVFDLLKIIKDGAIIPIYLQVKTKSFELFTKNFIGVLLYEYLALETGEIEDSFEFLLAKCKETAPKTAKAINNINKLLKDEAEYDEIYTQLLDLPQILYDETKKPVLLIFDEFQNLEDFKLSNPFLELSNKIMVQKNTMYIVVSSQIHNSLNILSKKLSLLFGNFEMINVQPFDNNIAGQFIENKLDKIKIDCLLKNFIIHFSGAYPFYLSVICEQLKCICLENSIETVTEKELLLSLIELMHNDHGVINQYFNHKYHAILNINHKNLYPLILLVIANGTKKTSQIGKQLNKKAPEINRHLTALAQKDIISKRGVFNEINDPLLIYWLRFVMAKQENSFSTDQEKATRRFEADIQGLLKLFIQESEKKVPQRLKEVFELFENDIVELDRKRFMLTHFDEIDIHDNNGACLVNARRLKKSWICCIEKNFVDEAKIGYFLEKAKRKEFIKKILITLDGIDANARLKALDAKVWIWDQNILNELLTLFEKPRLIKCE